MNIHCARTGQLLSCYRSSNDIALKTFEITSDSRFLVAPTFIGSVDIFDLELNQVISSHVMEIKIKHCELSYGDKDLLMVYLYDCRVVIYSLEARMSSVSLT